MSGRRLHGEPRWKVEQVFRGRLLCSRGLVSDTEISSVKRGLARELPREQVCGGVPKDRAAQRKCLERGVMRSLSPLLTCWVTSHCPAGVL